MSDIDFNYDHIADAYSETIDVAPYNAFYERPTMLGLLPPVDGKRILEAGCGAGWYTEQLLDRGAHVTAVDGSAPMVENARRRIAELRTSGTGPSCAWPTSAGRWSSPRTRATTAS